MRPHAGDLRYRGHLSLRSQSSRVDALSEVRSVPTDAKHEARTRGVQKPEPEEVQAWMARDAPAMDGLIRIIEHGQMHPTEVIAKSGRPNNRRDAGGTNVKRGARGRNRGSRGRRVGLGSVETCVLNVVVHRTQEMLAGLIGPGQGLSTSSAKMNFSPSTPRRCPRSSTPFAGNRRTSML